MNKSKEKVSLKRQLAASSFKYLLGKRWVPTDSYSALMYHRIINPGSVPYPLQDGMYVRPDTFRMHLEFLQKNARVIPLMDFIEEARAPEKKEKKKTVTITFDDGWMDFHDHAYPLLKEFNMPATVFLPTAYIGTSKLFWTDQLSLNLKVLSCSEKRTTISKRILEHCVDAVLSQQIITTLEEINNGVTITLDTIIEKLKHIEEEDRRNVCIQISNLAKEYSSPACAPQFLTWQQVKSISAEGLVSFGSHSHSHSILTSLTQKQVKDDITQATQVFKENLIPLLPAFCYPNQDRNSETDKLLDTAGFKYSVGRINKNEDPSSVHPPCLQRVGIHEDISKDSSYFSFRIWTNK